MFPLRMDLINIGLAFAEGLALIVSPCILPILPIILSVSLDGSKKRPLGVIVGFVISFTLFTLFARQIVLLLGLNLDVVRYVSFALLILLGSIMISSYLTEKFNDWTQGFADVALRFTQNDSKTDFYSGIVFGSLVGLIWTPCAGPILAAVIVQSILQHSNLTSFFTVFAFGLGAAIPMLIIIIFGRAIIHRLKYFQKNAGSIRKILGIVIILAVFLMMFGNNLFSSNVSLPEMVTTSGMELKDGLLHPFPAPDFKDITEWINSPPLHIQDLRGKVVLIDFWAFSCINCIRTMPYLLDWYNKYHDHGFEIVGVHSPEFDFERDPKNVEAAVKADGIHYPVALDNQFATWQSYNNLYWPAHYLVDKRGNVVYEHFGEGDYEITENNIRYLLGILKPMIAAEQLVPYAMITPETYLGYARSDEFSSNEARIKDQPAKYTYPEKLFENAWALKGSWIIQDERIVSNQKNAGIKIKFLGKKVFAVMGAAQQPINVKVKLNGAIATMGEGVDVHDGEVLVSTATLYRLIDLMTGTGGELELIATEPGLSIYTFTFGN